MKDCWSKDMTKRPEFSTIASVMDDQIFMWQEEEGVVPTRAGEIRAKKRKKNIKTDRLDVDTRISTPDDTTSRRFDGAVV